VLKTGAREGFRLSDQSLLYKGQKSGVSTPGKRSRQSLEDAEVLRNPSDSELAQTLARTGLLVSGSQVGSLGSKYLRTLSARIEA
jgi:hypothetical protein